MSALGWVGMSGPIILVLAAVYVAWKTCFGKRGL